MNITKGQTIRNAARVFICCGLAVAASADVPGNSDDYFVDSDIGNPSLLIDGNGPTGIPSLNETDNMYVGYCGLGSLSIRDEGILNVSGHLSFGWQVGAFGTAEFLGGGEIDVGQRIRVGAFGQGDITIRGGAVVEAEAVDVARLGGTGSLVVRGGTTVLRTRGGRDGPGGVHIGENGLASLALEEGALIETRILLVGRDYDGTDGNGTFVMGGASPSNGSLATLLAERVEFATFSSGEANVQITDGSFIDSSVSLTVDAKPGSTTSVDVSGATTRIMTRYFDIGRTPNSNVVFTLRDNATIEANTDSSNVNIGNAGSGSIFIESGARLFCPLNGIQVGNVNADGIGFLRASGTSALDGTPTTVSSKFFNVAQFSDCQGTAIFESGARLQVLDGIGVSGNPDDPGLLSVRGPSTTVSTIRTFIGDENPGRIELLGGTIFEGATLQARATTPGQFAELEINSGSQMILSDRADIADFGNASVTISNGSSFAGTGLVAVAGNGGTANIYVDGASAITTHDNMYIGAWVNGVADVTVTGAKSRIGGDGSQSTIRVGHRGEGELSVLNGASAEAQFFTIGGEFTGFGTALIAGIDPIGGTPSSLLAHRNINVGRDDGGVGFLTIANGGRLESPIMWIGERSGSTGTVEVRGNGALLTGFGGDPTLIVGEAGDGTLRVLEDGVAEWRTLRIGALVGSVGRVEVDGATLTGLGNTSRLNVGLSGDGSLSFGSSASSLWQTAFVGQNNKSKGRIELNGGSSLTLALGSLVGGATAFGPDGGDGEIAIRGSSQLISPALYLFNDGRLIGGSSPSQIEAQVLGDVFSSGLIRISGATADGIFRIDGDVGPRAGRYGQIRLAIDSLAGTPVHQKLSISGNADLDGSVIITASSPLAVSDPKNLPPFSIIEAGSLSGGSVFSQVESLPPVTGPGGEELYLRPFFTPQGVSLEVVTLSDLLSVDDLGGPTGLGGSNNAAIATGFLDGDNLEDIVVVRPAPPPSDPNDPELPGTVLVLLSDGDGTFTVLTDLVIPDPLYINPRSVTIGDFDADGDQDIAVGFRGSDRAASLVDPAIRFFFNDGTGTDYVPDTNIPTFDPIEIDDLTTPDGTFRGVPVSLVSGELLLPPNAGANADDLAAVIDYDTAGSDAEVDGLLIVAGRGQMALDDWEEICELPTGPRPGNAAIADPDGPGGAAFGNSIAVPIGADGDLAFYANTDPINGDFSSPPQIAAVGSDPREARAGDLDGDGLDDLVVLNAADGTLSILPNGSGIGGEIYARVADLPISGQNDPDSPDDDPKAIALAQGSMNGPLDLFVIAPNDGGSITVRGINNISTPGNFDFISVEDIPGTVPMGESPALLSDADVRGVGNEDLVVLTDVGRGFSSVLRVYPPSCPADLALPFGTLDLADISAFVTAFTTNDLSVDFDNNGALDLADITVFVESITGGCN